MKKTIFFLLAVGAAYLLGLVHGDAASRTRRVLVDLSRPMNRGRSRDGDYEYTKARSEDGRDVTLIWHR